MRILLICYVYPPEVAPAGIMTRELAEDLVADGHDVTVLAGWPNYPKGKLFDGHKMRWRACQKDPKGFSTLRCWHTMPDRKNFRSRIIFWFTFAISSFFGMLACRRFDVVYSHSTPIFGTFLTWLACRLKKSKYLYGVFDLYPEAAADAGKLSRGAMYRVCRKLDTWVCRRADGISTLSDGIRQTIAARGLPQEKIAVIPFWLDQSKFPPLPTDNAWRRENGIPSDKFVVLYAGTIGNISGAAMMADVAETMKDEPRALFLFVGEGVVKDDLIRLSREKRLDNMKFLPFQPAERLAEMQATADVGVITLLPGTGKNSIPSKILGYMAAGRAILVSVEEDSDTARCVSDGRCGLVVPPQDPAALAIAVRQLMEPGTATSLGRAAREYFLEKYSRSVNTKRYADLLSAIREGKQ